MSWVLPPVGVPEPDPGDWGLPLRRIDAAPHRSMWAYSADGITGRKPPCCDANRDRSSRNALGD